MNLYRAMICTASALYLTGCASDSVTFVTATDIGINADVKTEQLQLGYGRAEAFFGPGYPETGEVPEVVGSLKTNLSAFSPKIMQLYATGDAAGLVTQVPAPPQTAEQRPTYSGARRPLVFLTASNLGLKVGFAGNAPSSLKFGYNREEASIIPLKAATPTSNAPDQYASVLASIDLDQTTSTLSDTSIQLSQFFATGAAARNLAKRQSIRNVFQAEATAHINQAALKSWNGTVTSDNAKIKAYLEKNGAYQANRDTLLSKARASGIPEFQLAKLRTATSQDEFFTVLDDNVILTRGLALVIN
jgi:hypothetical protein